MRIAHIVSTFPPHVGGMGHICYHEAKRLAQAGHEVTVFTLRYPHTIYQDEQFSFKVVRFKPLVKIGDAGFIPQIIKHLKDFDLVHLHYPFYGGAEWLCFSKIPLIITYHMDAQLTGLKKVLQKIYDLIWPRFVFKKAVKIITMGSAHFARSLGTRFVSQDKIIEIANAVDIEIFTPGVIKLSDLGLEKLTGKNILVFAGNLLPVKRLDILLNALKIINNKNVALVVVGGGYAIKQYVKLTKDLSLNDQVFFVGFSVNENKLRDYYNIADCVVVPSDYESFSLVAAGAMACAKPVIVSDIVGLKDRIIDGVDGFLFTQGSAESLAQVLEKFLSLPAEKKKEMGQRGRGKIVKMYGWNRHMEKLLELYMKLTINK